jgi:hypothetical protein
MNQLMASADRRIFMMRVARIAIATSFIAVWSAIASAEPYIAVQQGLACGTCHVNATGGGMRTAVGNAFAQGVLPAQHVDTGDFVWTGAINKYIALGGDFRGDAAWSSEKSNTSTFNVEQARIYLGISLIPDRVLLYIDELVAPGVAANNEAWAMYRFGEGKWYVKAGQMYLAYGLRLQDQQAFIRQITGINMDSPDSAIELGYREGNWDAQFAISNGAAGGSQTSNGKQYTAQVARIRDTWRIGLGGNVNDNSGLRSTAGSLFGGLRTGPVSWLAEVDLVNERPAAQATRRLAATLLEANWLVQRGLNLKFTTEFLDPNRDHSGNLRTRFSFVGEYTPFQYIQLRLGTRFLNNVDSSQFHSLQQAFLEAHAYF